MSDVEKLISKINAQVKGFYLEGDVIVKAMRYLKRDGKVLFKRVDTGEEYLDEYKGSALFRKRIFIIGEVRNYERSGLLPTASRFRYSNTDYRYYTYNDVREIESFFNSQKVGRPPKNRVYSRNELSEKLRKAKKGIL